MFYLHNCGTVLTDDAVEFIRLFGSECPGCHGSIHSRTCSTADAEWHWNLFDVQGSCVYSIPFNEGDTVRDIQDWWDDFIKDEEYKPEVSGISLMEYNAYDWESGY